MFTVGAFDKFDHKYRPSLSGLSASQDTISTLFWSKLLETSSKSNKSEYDLKNVDVMEKLNCQSIKAFYKATKSMKLPDSFPMKNELYLREFKQEKQKQRVYQRYHQK